jgi:hypothetical protein
VVRSFGLFALIAIAALFASSGSQAGACGAKADRDNPMAWDEGFGVSRCRAQQPRYHVRDYDGESARGYATSSDPMVWSDTQWSGTLFDGYARTYDRRYDTRVRREPARAARPQIRIERRVEVTIREGVPELSEQAKPRGPKFLGARTAGAFKTNPGVLRFDGHDCRGVLVLTWGSLGGKARCHDKRTRINAAPDGQ